MTKKANKQTKQKRNRSEQLVNATKASKQELWMATGLPYALRQGAEGAVTPPKWILLIHTPTAEYSLLNPSTTALLNSVTETFNSSLTYAFSEDLDLSGGGLNSVY